MINLSENFYQNVKKYPHHIYLREDIDFTPESNQVIYYERSYNTLLNSFIKEHYAEICQILEKANKTFCYIPQKAHEIDNVVFTYYAPSMSPLPKAVYLLFLRHTEGILFRNLPFYRNELLDIYLRLTDRETGSVIMRSIDALTDPKDNSINEKCTRVREAFISRFNEKTLAKYYIIDGEYGREKKILLDRNLVVWEEEEKGRW